MIFLVNLHRKLFSAKKYNEQVKVPPRRKVKVGMNI